MSAGVMGSITGDIGLWIPTGKAMDIYFGAEFSFSEDSTEE